MPVLSLACHLPHNTPHIPSRYNNEQTTEQTKAINNSYIYINISCKCDTNRAGHFTLDAYASRPVACFFIVCTYTFFHFVECLLNMSIYLCDLSPEESLAEPLMIMSNLYHQSNALIHDCNLILNTLTDHHG